MPKSVTAQLENVHPQMLRAESESDPQRMGKRVIGRAIEVALSRAGITKQAAAYAMGYTDAGVIGRWLQGTETPQFAKLWTLERGDEQQREAFRRELVLALAERVGGIEIKTVVEIRKLA